MLFVIKGFLHSFDCVNLQSNFNMTKYNQINVHMYNTINIVYSQINTYDKFFCCPYVPDT